MFTEKKGRGCFVGIVASFVSTIWSGRGAQGGEQAHDAKKSEWMNFRRGGKGKRKTKTKTKKKKKLAARFVTAWAVACASLGTNTWGNLLPTIIP